MAHPPAPAEPGLFGAVYVNPRTGGGGKSARFRTKIGAEHEALFECRRYNGRGCVGVFWVEDSACGAVAFNRSRTVIYYAFALSVRGAEAKIRRSKPRALILGGTCGDRL